MTRLPNGSEAYSTGDPVSICNVQGIINHLRQCFNDFYGQVLPKDIEEFCQAEEAELRSGAGRTNLVIFFDHRWDPKYDTVTVIEEEILHDRRKQGSRKEREYFVCSYVPADCVQRRVVAVPAGN